jgi:uncharacterized membrane protein YdjX (TVP38/TMEM64 family)
MEWFEGAMETGLNQLQDSHPMWLIAALVVLPLVGMPISPLWILTGIRFGPAWGVAVGAATMLANITLAYHMAAHLLSRPIHALLRRRGLTMPSVPADDQSKFILLCRIAPGVPMLLQSFILGSVRVDFRRYILISFPVLTAFCAAFVIGGDALVHSDWWFGLLAFSLFLALLLILRQWRRAAARNLRLQKESAYPPSPDP